MGIPFHPLDFNRQGSRKPLYTRLSKEGLVSNLKSLQADLESGEVSYIRKVEELV